MNSAVTSSTFPASRRSNTRWTVVNDTMLPLVCFTHEDIREDRRTIDAIVRVVQDRARVWISDVVLGRREKVLRACTTSFRTDDEDLDVLVDELNRPGVIVLSVYKRLRVFDAGAFGGDSITAAAR
jgi:aromatic-L-amino-acid/L-tryptophan decarboxylase